MLSLPSSESSLLVRTDFTDDAAWQRVRSAALAESVDGFRGYVTVIDDRAYDGASWADVCQAATAGGEHAAVLFIADHSALGEDHPIQVLDLSRESRAPFRCIARELWSVDNNLNIANMDWDEFADNTDADGVFRGFDWPPAPRHECADRGNCGCPRTGAVVAGRSARSWFRSAVITQIRPATQADIEDLVALEARLFAADAGEHDPIVDITWPQRRGAADFAALLGNEKALVLVAADASGACGHLVGWVSESSEVRRGVVTGYLRSLFVEERARRHGVASELVERFVAWAEDEHGAVTVSVTAYAHNQDARAFYADLGFETLSVVLTRAHGLGQATLDTPSCH